MSQSLHTPDANTWQLGSHPVPPALLPGPAAPNTDIQRIIIGKPDSKSQSPDAQNQCRLGSLDLAALLAGCPQLTHLHLWQITDLQHLPTLPDTLVCLDIRCCPQLKQLRNLPASLQTLIVEYPHPDLTTLPDLTRPRHALRELSLAAATGLRHTTLAQLLAQAPRLQLVDLSQTALEILPALPDSVATLNLSSCSQLHQLPHTWPASLRRLELRDAARITLLADLPDSLQWLDLAGTSSLRQLPSLPGSHTAPLTPAPAKPTRQPRLQTLFLYRSAVPLNRDLYGEDDRTNVAARVLADQQASAAGRTPDCELKIILLGNGRCGKSSLARCLIHGHQHFQDRERSTHGVRLWEHQLEFLPLDGQYPSPDSENPDGRAQLNFWDFAGQSVYHSTHRLFLQSNAIYLICHNQHDDCPGADEATDKAELADLERQPEEINRPLQYWQNQVAALGLIPGRQLPPPVLIVRTKADRWIPDSLAPAEVPFSAKTGLGRETILQWISEQAATLLGSWPQRSLPSPAAAVKTALAPRIRENNQHYWQNEDKVSQSPHPHIPLSQFQNIVQNCCTGYYQQHPELLLERFHRSGFLYYDKQHLPDHVILDQRWAVQGIYTLTSRDSRFQIREELLRRRGRFTPALLNRLSWQPAGFSPEAQQLFLQFMTSCGMCFPLLTREESLSGEPHYAAPGFFPLRDHDSLSSDSQDPPDTKHYQLPNVAEADVSSLIARIGADWGRSMDAWRWGCQFRSARSTASCILDWSCPPDSHQYFHPLQITFRGDTDPPFQNKVLEYLQETFGRDNPLIPPAATSLARTHDLQQLRVPDTDDKHDPQQDPQHDSPTPSRSSAVGIEIALSFAGPEPNATPPDLRPEIPRQLAQILQHQLSGLPNAKVTSYSLDNEISRLDNFITELAKGDLVLVFWSPRYWQSEYCCCELMKIYQMPPANDFDRKNVTICCFDNARLGTTATSLNAADWGESWKTKAQDRLDKARKRHKRDEAKVQTVLQREGPIHDWFQFVFQEQQFNDFITCLQNYRQASPLDVPRDPTHASELAAALAENTLQKLHSPENLLFFAQQRFRRGLQTSQEADMHDAVELLRKVHESQPHNGTNFAQFVRNLQQKKIIDAVFATWAIGLASQPPTHH